jgi:hypothetical protein
MYLLSVDAWKFTINNNSGQPNICIAYKHISPAPPLFHFSNSSLFIWLAFRILLS